MMTLSLCCTCYMLLMVVIKPCETSIPKQQLGWDGCLSHGSMAVMNSLLIIYALSSRSMQEKKYLRQIFVSINSYYYFLAGFWNLTL
jgi:hypothetical protein